MKRAITFVLAIMLGLGTMAIAGPFVGFDFTVPDDGTLYFGVEAGELTLEWSVCDLFLYDAEDALPTLPTLTFDAEHFTEFSYWDNDLGFWIKKIDFVSAYPIPEIEGIGFSWCGTLYVGDLAAVLRVREDPSQTVPISVFNIYGKVSFEYMYDDEQLVPTGSFGFYWKP